MPAGRRGAGTDFLRLAVTCWACGVLLVLLCGCELFKPPARSDDAAIRSFFDSDKAKPASSGSALPSSSTATRAGTGMTAAQPAETTRAPSRPQAQSQPQPAIELKRPPAQPAKGAEKLIAARPAAFSAPISDPASSTSAVKAAATTSSATTGSVSRPGAGQLIVKGPPRSPRRGWTGHNPLLWPALGLVALLAALAIYSRRSRLLPRRGTRVGEQELVLPGEFKMKDSVIPQSPAAMGMLVPDAHQRSSIFRGLLAVLGLAASKAAALGAGVFSSLKRVANNPSAPPPSPRVGSTAMESNPKARARV